MCYQLVTRDDLPGSEGEKKDWMIIMHKEKIKGP